MRYSPYQYEQGVERDNRRSAMRHADVQVGIQGVGRADRKCGDTRWNGVGGRNGAPMGGGSVMPTHRQEKAT